MERYSIVDSSVGRTQGDSSQRASMPWPTESAPVVDVAAHSLEDDRRLEDRVPPKTERTSSPDVPFPTLQFPGEDGGKSLLDMAQRDLDATLRLLAERAQYITEATGAAIALRENDEMVCRASAGSSAPAMGATLQVDSGLTGESVHTRKILYCEDAETDPRVNRESCQALGIASVVVMPLLREQEVSGLFELFSDKPNAFTQRDIAALERLGEMVQVALDHAEAARTVPEALAPASTGQSNIVPGTAPVDNVSGKPKATAAPSASPAPFSQASEPAATTLATAPAASKRAEVRPTASAVTPDPAGAKPVSPAITDTAQTGKSVALDPLSEMKPSLFESPSEPAVATSVRAGEASSIRKCEKCGFPISVGRTLCLDCEPKSSKPTGPNSASASGTDSLASLPGRDSTSAEGRSFLCNPYMIAALVLTVLLAVAFWMSHSS